MTRRTLVAAWLLALAAGCGSTTSNVENCQSKLKIHPCAKTTALEDAQNALDRQDYDTAIADLIQVVSDDPPDDYSHYPMLAGAYMARAGLDLTTLLTKSLSSSGSGGGGSFLTQITTIVPNPDTPGRAFDDRVTDMKAACDELDAITATWLQAPTGGVDATSVALQKTIYHVAYSAAIVNQVTGGDVANQTPQQLAANLAKMTPDQAANFIGSLVQAGNLPPQVSGDPKVAAQVQATLDKVKNPDGSVNTQQLAGLLAGAQASGTFTATSTATGTGTGTGT